TPELRGSSSLTAPSIGKTVMRPGQVQRNVGRLILATTEGRTSDRKAQTVLNIWRGQRIAVDGARQITSPVMIHKSRDLRALPPGLHNDEPAAGHTCAR